MSVTFSARAWFQMGMHEIDVACKYLNREKRVRCLRMAPHQEYACTVCDKWTAAHSDRRTERMQMVSVAWGSDKAS